MERRLGVARAGRTDTKGSGRGNGRMAKAVNEPLDDLQRFEREQQRIPEPIDWDRIERQHEAQAMREWEEEELERDDD